MDPFPSEEPAQNSTVSRAEKRLFASVAFLERAASSVYLWWIISLALAAALAWENRHYVNPDGLSYLDLAPDAVNSGPARLLRNTCWSPGYPALISIALLVFHPGPSQEFPIIHLLNFFVFGLTLWAFSYFLRSWTEYTRQTDSRSSDIEKSFLPFAYVTFLWFTLEYSGVALVTPDLCVAAIIFLVAAIGTRLSLPGSSWTHYLALGLAIAVGFYFKNAMLPLGLALIGLLCVLSPVGVKRRRLLMSLIVILVLSSPAIAVFSARVGRLSFGETGRLNYLWLVNGLPSVGWTGDPSGVHGTPYHAPRVLTQTPLTLEFASPIGGTYPLWTNPSYWYAGAKVRINLRQQYSTLKVSLQKFQEIITRTAVFLAGLMVLVASCLRERLIPTIPRRFWWHCAWPFSAFSMYALVLVETRYIIAFLVLFWLTIYSAFVLRLKGRGTAPVLATVACVCLLLMGIEIGGLLYVGIQTLRGRVRPTQPGYEMIAEDLRNLGLQRGDCLAIVGSAFYPYDAYPYYARVDRLRVVAQVPDADAFWRLDRQELESLEEKLITVGVKAIVVTNRPLISAPAEWQDLRPGEGSRFSVLILTESQRDHH